MNRRSFLLFGAVMALPVACADIAAAVRLPVSTVTVNILSVDRVSYARDDYRHESFKPGEPSTERYEEKTTYLAKAQIETVGFNDHDLSPGMVIDIRYEVSGGSAPIYARTPPLIVKAGERWTVSIFGGGKFFTGRDWKRPQPNTPVSSNQGGKQ
jgi:hypothetical protein